MRGNTSTGTGESNSNAAISSQVANSKAKTTHKQTMANSIAQLQATAEQIRQAKLSQLPGHDDKSLQPIISEVAEVTGKPLDTVSVALHDCNYDAHLAIQNLLDGMYDAVESEWKTSTKKKRSGSGLADEQAPDSGRHYGDQLDEFDMKPASKFNRQSKGKQGHIGKKNNDSFGFGADQNNDSYNGRGRGRGRGGFRGDTGGSRRGGRGGSTRSRGRSSRGRTRGTGRGRFGDRTQERNNFSEPFKCPSDDDSWDTTEVQQTLTNTAEEDGWGNNTETDGRHNVTGWTENDAAAPELNGSARWGDEAEEIQPESTSNLLNRNENDLSGEFPSASEGVDPGPFDITSYTQEPTTILHEHSTESNNAPMITGVHESHMLEADLLPPKVKSQKQKKPKPRSNEPVQMPQGLFDDITEVNHQLGGLEFGGEGSLSPVLLKHEPSVSVGQLSSLPITQSPPSTSLEAYRHSVASNPVSAFNASPIPVDAAPPMTEKPKTPPGLGSLQDNPPSHSYPTSPRHMQRMGKAPNPIPYPKQDKNMAPGLVSSAVGTSPYKSAISTSRKNQDVVGNGLSSELNQSALHHINISDSSTLPTQYVASSLVSPSVSAGVRNQSGMQLSENNLSNLQPSTGSSSNFNSSSSASSKQFQGTGNKHNPASGGVMPLNVYPNVQPGILPGYQQHAMASPMAYDEMLVHGMPMSPYYDLMYAPQNPSQSSAANRSESSFAGDGKFSRESSASQAVSSMSQGNQHSAGAPHHVQQQPYMNANTALPYHHYYYPPGMIPSGFPVYTTAPPIYQVGNGKGHAGTQYQSAFSQHGSHSYNTGGGQDYNNKGSAYSATAVTVSSQSTKSSSQSSGSGGNPSSVENSLGGYKNSMFGGQDMKNYIPASPAAPLGIPMPHAHNPMGNYPPAQYMMQPSMLQHPGTSHVGHPSMDSGGLHSSRVQQGHHGIGSQSQKRGESKSYWSGSS